MRSLRPTRSRSRRPRTIVALAWAVLGLSTGPAFATTVTSLGENFDAGPGTGTFVAHISVGQSGDSAWRRDTLNPHAGAGDALGSDFAHVTDNTLTASSAIAIPAQNTTAKLSFFHTYGFESGFDGGVLERSIDGGAFADFAPSDFVSNGPNVTLNSSFGNPLGGHLAWSGVSGAGSPAPYIRTVVNLSPYAGHDLTVRFRIGTDSSNGAVGWTVDDIDAGITPEAVTGAATAIAPAGATVLGSIAPHSTPTSARVEYGPTTAYGTSTPAIDEGSDAATHPLSQALTGLSAATTYHYRVVADYPGGSASGADATFTTSAAPPPPADDPKQEDPPPPAEGTPPAGQDPAPPTGPTVEPVEPPAFAGVGVLTKRVAARHGVVRLRLSCPSLARGRCVGSDALSVRRRGVKKALHVGRRSFSISAGRSATIRVRLSHRALALLRHGTLAVRQTVVAHDDRATIRTTTRSLRLRR
jgi:hypothetical protein